MKYLRPITIIFLLLVANYIHLAGQDWPIEGQFLLGPNFGTAATFATYPEGMHGGIDISAPDYSEVTVPMGEWHVCNVEFPSLAAIEDGAHHAMCI